MQIVRGGHVQAEPNVVPLIDIMMVLMIIFMILAAAQQEALFAQMVPKAGEGQPAGEDDKIILEVGLGPRYAINQQEVRADSLGIRLRAIYTGRPNKVIYVRGDGRAPYQDIVTAIDIARDAGVSVVGLWTERR
jgi:biopolymer transport protein ExbD